MRKVKLQILFGDQDAQTQHFAVHKGLDSSRNDERPAIDKAREFFTSWRAAGLNMQFDIVPGIVHRESSGCRHALAMFLAEQVVVWHLDDVVVFPRLRTYTTYATVMSLKRIHLAVALMDCRQTLPRVLIGSPEPRRGTKDAGRQQFKMVDSEVSKYIRIAPRLKRSV